MTETTGVRVSMDSRLRCFSARTLKTLVKKRYGQHTFPLQQKRHQLHLRADTSAGIMLVELLQFPYFI